MGLLIACLLFGLAIGQARAAASYDSRFADGMNAYGSGRYDQAISQFTAARQIDHNQSLPLLWIGRAHFKLGHAEQALDYYESFEKEQPAPTEPYLKEAKEKAQAYLEELIVRLDSDYRRDPKQAELLLLKGRAQVLLGRMADALASFEGYQQAKPKPEPKPVQDLTAYYSLLAKTFQATAAGLPLLQAGRAHLGLFQLALVEKAPSVMDEADETMLRFDGYRQPLAKKSGKPQQPDADERVAYELALGVYQGAYAHDDKLIKLPLWIGRLHFLLGQPVKALSLFDKYSQVERQHEPDVQIRLDRYIKEAKDVVPVPLYKRPWFWVAIGAGAAVVATGIALGVTRPWESTMKIPL